jgi:hypothetical protein
VYVEIATMAVLACRKRQAIGDSDVASCAGRCYKAGEKYMITLGQLYGHGTLEWVHHCFDAEQAASMKTTFKTLWNMVLDRLGITSEQLYELVEENLRLKVSSGELSVEAVYGDDTTLFDPFS